MPARRYDTEQSNETSWIEKIKERTLQTIFTTHNFRFSLQKTGESSKVIIVTIYFIYWSSSNSWGSKKKKTQISNVPGDDFRDGCAWRGNHSFRWVKLCTYMEKWKHLLVANRLWWHEGKRHLSHSDIVNRLYSLFRVFVKFIYFRW